MKGFCTLSNELAKRLITFRFVCSVCSFSPCHQPTTHTHKSTIVALGTTVTPVTTTHADGARSSTNHKYFSTIDFPTRQSTVHYFTSSSTSSILRIFSEAEPHSLLYTTSYSSTLLQGFQTQRSSDSRKISSSSLSSASSSLSSSSSSSLLSSSLSPLSSSSSSSSSSSLSLSSASLPSSSSPSSSSSSSSSTLVSSLTSPTTSSLLSSFPFPRHQSCAHATLSLPSAPSMTRTVDGSSLVPSPTPVHQTDGIEIEIKPHHNVSDSFNSPNNS